MLDFYRRLRLFLEKFLFELCEELNSCSKSGSRASLRSGRVSLRPSGVATSAAVDTSEPSKVFSLRFGVFGLSIPFPALR